jgi:hypothetical protein
MQAPGAAHRRHCGAGPRYGAHLVEVQGLKERLDGRARGRASPPPHAPRPAVHHAVVPVALQPPWQGCAAAAAASAPAVRAWGAQRRWRAPCRRTRRERVEAIPVVGQGAQVLVAWGQGAAQARRLGPRERPLQVPAPERQRRRRGERRPPLAAHARARGQLERAEAGEHLRRWQAVKAGGRACPRGMRLPQRLSTGPWVRRTWPARPQAEQGSSDEGGRPRDGCAQTGERWQGGAPAPCSRAAGPGSGRAAARPPPATYCRAQEPLRRACAPAAGGARAGAAGAAACRTRPRGAPAPGCSARARRTFLPPAERPP